MSHITLHDPQLQRFFDDIYKAWGSLTEYWPWWESFPRLLESYCMQHYAQKTVETIKYVKNGLDRLYTLGVFERKTIQTDAGIETYYRIRTAKIVGPTAKLFYKD